MPVLCARLGRWLDGVAAGGEVVCDLSGLVAPGLAAVDAVARLALTAGRRGHRLVVRGAGPELRALLALAGLADRFAEPGQPEPEQPGPERPGRRGVRPPDPLSPPAAPGGRTAGTSA